MIIYSQPGTDPIGMDEGYEPVVANWLQTTNDNSGYADDAFTGIFSPIINPDGVGDQNQSKLKELVTHVIPGTNNRTRIVTYGLINLI